MSLKIETHPSNYVEYVQEDSTEDWRGRRYPEWELELIDADHLRLDEQGWS